jgi:ArsR family transcriptional regulator, repressor of sdpIR and other operons
MIQQTDPLTNTLRALADPTRCRILELLHRGSRSVNDLAQHFSMTRPAVSKHLAILREADLVRSRRQGRQQIYELDPAPLAPARAWLRGFESGAGKDGGDDGETRPPARRIPRPARRDDWRCW